MQRFITRRTIVLFTLIMGLVIGLYFFSPQAPEKPLAEHASWDDQVAYWERVIKRDGADAAYVAFADRVAAYPQVEQHTSAHAFGSALFTIENKRGISTCDARFSFGCFHQFLGDAIQSLGLNSVGELNQACFNALSKSPLSCQHGIGHGALAALGYDEKSLLHALEICRNLPGSDPIGGCYGGVFMEYNFQTMLAEAAEVRPYADDAFAPCSTLESEYIPACIFWQPQWWSQSIVEQLERSLAFERMGKMCETYATTEELARACFEGIGNIVEQESQNDPARAAALCDASSVHASHRLMCRALGANHFGIDRNTEAGQRVCEGLTGRAYEYCDAYARNESNIAAVRALPL